MSLEWKDVANYLWLAILPLLKWIWARQEKDIAAVAADLKARIESDLSTFSTREQHNEHGKLLEARRLDVISLHDKIDDRAGKLDDKVEALTRDMNKGFMETQRLILDRLK